MANTLTADQIARMLRGELWTDPNYGSGGYSYQPTFGSYQGGGAESGYDAGGVGPVTGLDRISSLGDRRFHADTFDTQGNQIGQRDWRDGSMLQDALKGAALVGGGALGFNALASAYGNPSALWGLSDGGAGADMESASTYSGGSAYDAPGSLAGNADKAALYGDAGYGAGMSGAATGAYDAGIKAAGPGLTGLLGDYGKYLAPLLGAVVGSQGSPGATTTQQRSLDPRIDSAYFGDGGLLSQALGWLKANPGGQNDTMKLANQRSRDFLGSDGVQQAIWEAGNAGMNLLRGKKVGG